MMSNDATSDKDQLRPGVFKQTYFHGTKADLQLGDVIATGVQTNYQETGSKLQGCTSRESAF